MRSGCCRLPSGLPHGSPLARDETRLSTCMLAVAVKAASALSRHGYLPLSTSPAAGHRGLYWSLARAAARAAGTSGGAACERWGAPRCDAESLGLLRRLAAASRGACDGAAG